ncbi:hypothetical protein AB0945_23975 [Streptomyces sp. NPDC005474]|uniref:hypothetical protein n=1 Tax=Streptomyces sp. NPDC005474 TaxID=3154878 RepID=UPI003454D68C
MRTLHDELRAELRETAEAYVPDRARILARVERGMAAGPEEKRRSRRRATRPPLLAWARVVGATAAVSGILAMGGYALASVVKSDETPADPTVSVSPMPTPSPDATSRAPIQPAPQPSGGNTKHDGPSSAPKPTPTPTPKASNTAPAPVGQAEDGPLWSGGSIGLNSNEFWAQSDLTIKSTEQLTALTVELKVADTGGVTSTGAWRSAPEDDFELTVAQRDGFLVYTWVLKAGRSVQPGEWVFAGQYNHARGVRDVKGDTYTVTAEAGGKKLSVQGGFVGQDGKNQSADGDS